MSRGHGASRRRNYGPRQRDVRRRPEAEREIDLNGPQARPRTGLWPDLPMPGSRVNPADLGHDSVGAD